MGNPNNKLLVLVAVVLVNSSLGHVIPQPLTASFSGSSSSASAFSHSSSSSYNFNGSADPKQIEELKQALSAGALAHASAGVIAGAGAVAGASAVAGSAAQGGAAAKAGADVASGAAAGGNPGKEQETNSISESTVPADAGTYKTIESDKYTTGYTSGAKTNYAVSNNYVQGSQNAVGGCASCKGPFPGPNGSIHDYKLASSVPAVSSVQSEAGAAAVSHQTPATLPGSSGNIYTTQPSSGYQGGSSGSSEYSGSGHVSPGLIASLPGPSGSIYDSKPVGAVAVATAGAASSSGVGQSNIGSASPCAFSSGSSNCAPAPHGSSATTGSGLSGIIAVLPGPSGSIYDSKPAVPGSHGPAAVAGSGAYSGAGSFSGSSSLQKPVSQISGHSNSGAGAFAGAQAGAGASGSSYDGTGSITNNPTTHSASKPASQVSSNAVAQAGTGAKGPFPGPSGSIHDYKPAHPVSSGVQSGYSGSGSATHIPSTQPAVAPACSFSPGSSNGCAPAGSVSGSSAGISDHQSAHSGSSLVESGSSSSSYGSGSSASSGNSGSSAPVSNIPASHPVVGPACSYTPGSPNQCSGGAVGAPSIHPELPSSGTYYINKPSTDVEPPALGLSPSFSSQYPCADSSCGTVQAGAGSNIYPESGVVYVDQNQGGQYQGLNHDNAHLSGGVVFQNEDGTYSNVPTPVKPTYKNADKGGYAVSSNEADNRGVLIGPGTGNLPVEADSKPFGTQGAFGGSAAYAKGASGTQGIFGGANGVSTKQSNAGELQTDSKQFGAQGAFGGSAAFAQGASGSQGAYGGANGVSTKQSNAENHSAFGSGSATGQVTIQKSEGVLVQPEIYGSDKQEHLIGSPVGTEFGSHEAPVKLQSCSSCGDTEVIASEPSPSSSQSGAGASGYATGQVLVNQGGNTYDATNAGSFSGSSQFGSPGCGTGKCGFGAGSFAGAQVGGILEKLFGGGGLSGGGFNRFGTSQAGSAAYSSSGSYSGASAGSFASAQAGASAHAGSYARSY